MTTAAQTTAPPTISAPQLVAQLAGPTPPVVLDASYLLEHPEFDGDYRSTDAREGFERAHVPGALYVDVARQFSDPRGSTHYTHPSPQAVVDELARLGIGEGAPVVVYDTTQTIFAARLWYLLRWVGVDARVLDGGLAAWTTAGQDVETGPTAPPAAVAPWSARETRAAWVTRTELVARATADERPLVCGLPAGSFAGTAVSRYSRRGRIPGSVNVSARALFAPDGTMLPAAEIAEAYRAVGVDGSEEVLLYCGGGISASANALTLAAIGIDSVRIYDGSLEEWSTDESLPLETDAETPGTAHAER
ncbi:sulfurtransferase [Marisediminicola sp. LYQ134]|uniref:sulfurtransferase n=1 Tax=Marisediminicola sp. LYQ134 TaxID=3391061 RepID=UPI0039838EF4